MADIVIRGMEMPKTCVQCDLKTYDPEKIWNDNGVERIGVWVCKRTREIIWNTQRGEECPLVPLPEKHGRLIDADALESIIGGFSLNWEYGQGVSDCWDALISAQTILEAEGGLRNDS